MIIMDSHVTVSTDRNLILKVLLQKGVLIIFLSLGKIEAELASIEFHFSLRNLFLQYLTYLVLFE